ncbi:hypothetical protein AAIH09_33970, partial [Pseudomonas aeruginosa]|uniref:hypothetical protein n=1 Tax=Pseudomonas aeruginosa TaxID=287 RepID=UPI0031B6E6EE
MSEMEKLAAMLSQKKLQQEQVKEDAENQYQQWVESLKRLYRDMEEWLQPLVTSGGGFPRCNRATANGRA